VIGAAEQAVVADAAAEEAKAGRGEAGGTCKNCGASLVGSHCHVCGQVNDQLHRPIWSLVADAMEGFFSLDGRFLKTVPALMFKPGRVSANYLAGARARFVQPFRLLLFASVVFLIAVSTVTGDWWTAVEFDSDDIDASLEEISEELTALADELEQNENASPQEVAALRAEIAAMQAAETVGESAGLTQMRELRRLQQQRAIKCALRREILPEDLGDCPETPMASEPDITISGVDGAVDPEDLTWPVGVRRFIVERAEVIVDDPAGYFEAVNTWVSTVLIALFPVYAAILGLTHFWKRRFFYYDHLIVSLHFHAFLFILITALIAIWPIVSWAVAVPVFFVWSNLYLYKVHRLVYGCGRFSSVLRTLVMDFLYLIVLSFVPAALLLGGFLTA
jgi:hypothetical protein